MRVFSVPLSVPFLRTVIAALIDGRLVEGFEARRNPAALAEATLYLPTRRAVRVAREVFLDELKATPRYCRASCRSATSTRTSSPLPTRPSSSTAPQPLDIPPKLGELDRRLTLAHLVAAWAKGSRLRRWWSAARPRRWRWPPISRG